MRLLVYVEDPCVVVIATLYLTSETLPLGVETVKVSNGNLYVELPDVLEK